MPPCFETVEDSDLFHIIRDVGPWDQHLTITNGAEWVVEFLYKNKIIKNGKRLLYYDSENELSELLHENGKLIGYITVETLPKIN